MLNISLNTLNILKTGSNNIKLDDANNILKKIIECSRVTNPLLQNITTISKKND